MMSVYLPGARYISIHTRQHTHRCGRDGRSHDGGGIDAAVLRAVGDDVDRNQLQRRNVQDQI